MKSMEADDCILTFNADRTNDMLLIYFIGISE